MKKNISINISGIIFHIEEDGYMVLKEYLESINAYFSSYEDSTEIIADIESRIAEIFLAKLDEGNQVVTQDDVDALIATMGTTADFQAIEDEEDVKEERQQQQTSSSQATADDVPPKRLYRNEKKRVIGGVASGIAHYFGIDPIWVRLILLLLFFNVLVGPISGGVFICYIILWIVIPGSTELTEDKEVKKMYRNPDSRVLGGVASGIAAYFGVDTTVIRLVFILTLFLGGSGLILYIILWLITPEAKTITEKMQMQGEPVTLSNIEQNVKESLNVREGEENVFVKILLFPFRVIAAIFQAIGRFLGPASRFLAEALRVVVGLFIAVVGIMGMIGLVISASVMIGFMSAFDSTLFMHHLPLDLLKTSIPTLGYVAIFIASFVPFLGLALLGISILAKRMLLNATIGWLLFGFWLLSMIGLGITIPKVATDFSSEGEYRETMTYNFADKNAIIDVLEAGLPEYEQVTLKILGHSDSLYKLDMRYRARGGSREKALKNARMIEYNVKNEGNHLYFDSNLSLKKGAKFRAQELDMTLYIPYYQVFQMTSDLRYILRNTISRRGYHSWQLEGNNWMFTEKGLSCLTCENKAESEESKAIEEGERMVFDMKDFAFVEAHGNVDVIISNEDTYHVEVVGLARYLEDVYVKQHGENLTIDYQTDNLGYLKSSDKKPVTVYLSMPALTSIKGQGAASFSASGFEQDNFAIELSGASSADINLQSNTVKVRLKGTSWINLSGKTELLDVDISGASSVKAYHMSASEVNIDAAGASSAKVSVKDKLYVESAGMSSIRYKGSPEVYNIDEDGLSSVKRSD